MRGKSEWFLIPFFVFAVLLSALLPSAVHAASPCCAVTSINGVTGIVTAKETATGRIFTFKAADAALLKSLHVGQAIDANFDSRLVSVNPAQPCCAIVDLGSAKGMAQAKAPAAPDVKAESAAATKPEMVHDYQVDGVKVTLLSVARTSGDTITVRWQYRNESSEPQKIGETFRGMGSSEAYSLVWDSYVADTGSKTKYTVLKDSRGEPVAAAHGGSKLVTLAPKAALSTWAKFAVPADVKQVTVVVPGVEPFEDIPIPTPAK
jgi:hypothetical protein